MPPVEHVLALDILFFPLGCQSSAKVCSDWVVLPLLLLQSREVNDLA